MSHALSLARVITTHPSAQAQKLGDEIIRMG
jgi:hypothetical protein